MVESQPWWKKLNLKKNEKEPKYNLDEGTHEYNPYGKDGNNDIKMADLTDELPEYDLNDLQGDYNPLDYFLYYRYAINAVFVALPWITVALSMLFYNLYFNIAWNKFWASGNFYLVVNSLYMLF